jgi:hypothetical protein
MVLYKVTVFCSSRRYKITIFESEMYFGSKHLTYYLCYWHLRYKDIIYMYVFCRFQALASSRPIKSLSESKQLIFLIELHTVIYDSVLFPFCSKWKRNSCNIMKSFIIDIIHANEFTWLTEILKTKYYMFL